MADRPSIMADLPSRDDYGRTRKDPAPVWLLLRTLFFIVIGWYLIKWLARWIAGGSAESGRSKTGQREDGYQKLTDQKIEDADFEDISGDGADDT